MNSLKTIGKVFVLTALVATQAQNAHAVSMPKWAKNAYSKTSGWCADKAERIKNLHWKNKTVSKGSGWTQGGEHFAAGDQVPNGVNIPKEVVPGVWSGIKAFGSKVKSNTWDQLTKENCVKAKDGFVSAVGNAKDTVVSKTTDLYNDSAEAADVLLKWMNENRTKTGLIFVGVFATTVAIALIIKKLKDKNKTVEKSPEKLLEEIKEEEKQENE